MITTSAGNIGFAIIEKAQLECEGVDEYGEEFYGAGCAVLEAIVFAGDTIERELDCLGWELESINSQSVAELARCMVNEDDPHFNLLVEDGYNYSFVYVSFKDSKGEDLYYCKPLFHPSNDRKFPCGIYSESIAMFLNDLY